MLFGKHCTRTHLLQIEKQTFAEIGIFQPTFYIVGFYVFYFIQIHVTGLVVQSTKLTLLQTRI